MLKERLAAIDLVASTFLPAEQAADHAALEGARALAAMLEARQNANVPLSTGLDIISKATQAVTMLVEGRRHLVEIHPMLDTIPGRMGIKTHAYGKDVSPTAAVAEPVLSVA